jgi:uncharacterized protein YegJ (DUF2314 family)
MPAFAHRSLSACSGTIRNVSCIRLEVAAPGATKRGDRALLFPTDIEAEGESENAEFLRWLSGHPRRNLRRAIVPIGDKAFVHVYLTPDALWFFVHGKPPTTLMASLFRPAGAGFSLIVRSLSLSIPRQASSRATREWCEGPRWVISGNIHVLQTFGGDGLTRLENRQTLLLHVLHVWRCFMIWIAIAAIVALIAAAVFWWIRRRNRPRLISIVALTREPVSFDPAVLARVAGKAWEADLGDGESEGPDGFVGGGGMMNAIMHQGRMFMINSLPKPYMDDVEKACEFIKDLRVRELFREHQAWFSCDAMGVDAKTPEEEVVDWYRQIGTLFAELLDENCLLIFLPDSELAFPINEDTETALRSKDPVGALRGTMTVPFVAVADDDPLLVRAVAQARDEWPRFVTAFESREGKGFSVKAPVTHADNTEFIWITVTALEGDRIYGELGNDPANLGALKFGSKVSVPLTDLNDWCFMDQEGKLTGGFTVEAVQKAQRRKRTQQ